MQVSFSTGRSGTLLNGSRRTLHRKVLRINAFQETPTRQLRFKSTNVFQGENHIHYYDRQNTKSVVAFILGGGPSDYNKLFPLTSKRALPAIPIGGVYRLVDIPISNLVNSGIDKMYIITQFQSQSLNKYLTNTYNLSGGVPMGGRGFIEILTATQSPQGSQWSLGTADAVRQFSWILEDMRFKRGVEDIIILPSDQLYRTDFSAALAQHRRTGAAVTVLVTPSSEEEAEHMGVVQVAIETPGGGRVNLNDIGLDNDQDVMFRNHASAGPEYMARITSFTEKPTGPSKDLLRTDPLTMKATQKSSRRAMLAAEDAAIVRGGGSLDPDMKGRTLEERAEVIARLSVKNPYAQLPYSDKPFLGSTGIYIFNRNALLEMLREFSSSVDFGRDVLPEAIAEGYKVMAFEMFGIWRDVGGSIRDFWKANMEIVGTADPETDRHLPQDPHLRSLTSPLFFDPTHNKQPLFKAPQFLPPVQYNGAANLHAAFISPGCILGKNVTITNTMIGQRSIIGDNTQIDHSVIMGSDFYEQENLPVTHHDAPPQEQQQQQAEHKDTHENEMEEESHKRHIPVGIGEGCVIKNAIIDKNARVGRNVQLVNKDNLHSSNSYAAIGVYIVDNLVVVSKSAVIPDGTVI